jgi:hypothetical protein
MRKMFLFSLFFIFAALLFAGCEQNTSDYLEDGFDRYVSDNEIEFKDSDVFKYIDFRVSKEDTEYSPKIIVTPDVKNMPREVFVDWHRIKSNLKSYGDAFVAYAKTTTMDNSYYLYVTYNLWDMQFIYDYERDVLYVPEDHYKISYMNQHFTDHPDIVGFLDFDEIATTEKGRQYLMFNGYAEMRHGELEPTDGFYSLGSGGIVVVYNGEFKSFLRGSKQF